MIEKTDQKRRGGVPVEQAAREQDVSMEPLGHFVLRKRRTCEAIDRENSGEREDEDRDERLEYPG